MARRVRPPSNPRPGMWLHEPTTAADPYADVVCIQFWCNELDIRSTTNDRGRLRSLLGMLVARLVENPSLLDEIAGLRSRKGPGAA